MSTLSRLWVGLLLIVFLVIAVALLMRGGVYGFTLFCASPAILGGIAVVITEPDTPSQAAWTGARVAAGATLLLLLLGVEGIICIIMALPLVTPLGALGGWLVFTAQNELIASRSSTFLLLLPLATLSFDMKAHAPVYAVTTQVIINASPEQVWKYAPEFSPISESREWYFHTGVAYPQRTRLEGQGVGARRYCDLSTGPVVEHVTAWEPARLLAFDVISTPDAMREWSPYGEIRPKHLHGYYVSKKGEFRLTPLPGGRTLLQGTSWYQHGLWPAEYWRWWSDAIIHRIHIRVLKHVRELAEADARKQN